jgi:predicted AlkP superfamily phosphohydrolase/phosphomutase
MTRTLLIGLDGATFRILEPLMAAGVMPHLRDMAARGARAGLMSTCNPVTPPAWTSVMTGRSPGRHGVFDFVRAEEREGEMYFTLYDARDIGCETIWSAASRQGLRATSLNFPMMFPHPPIDGHIVPGLTSWRHMKMGTRPHELHDELKALAGVDFKEMAWDFELGKKVVYGVPPEEYETWIRFHIRRERHWFAVARHLMTTDPAELVGVLWDGPDKLFHICWRFLDPEWLPRQPTPWEVHIRQLCLEYFASVDRYIAELTELAGPDSYVVIVSDHGFGPTIEEFHVNTWLAERGYLAWRAPRSAEEAASASWKRRVKSNFVLLDWSRTTAYARTSSSNGIYIRRARGTEPGGIADGEYHAFRERLIRELKAIVNPRTGAPAVRHVWRREEVFPGPYMEQAPDLTLVLHDYGFISIRPHSPALQRRPEVTGTHCPEGILIAHGPGIRQGVRPDPLSILDVAPLVLHTLGLPIGAELEGRIPIELFDAEWNAAHQGRRETAGPAEPVVVPVGAAVADDAAGEAAVFERLRSLGYLE